MGITALFALLTTLLGVLLIFFVIKKNKQWITYTINALFLLITSFILLIVFFVLLPSNKKLKQKNVEFENIIANKDKTYEEQSKKVNQEIETIRNSEDFFINKLNLKSSYFNSISEYAFRQYTNWDEFITYGDFSEPYNYEYELLDEMKESNYYKLVLDELVDLSGSNSFVDHSIQFYMNYIDYNTYFETEEEKSLEEVMNSETKRTIDYYGYEVISHNAFGMFTYNFIKETNREASNVKRIWNIAKDLLFKSIRKEDMNALESESSLRFVDNLIKSYKQLKDVPNHKFLFKTYDFRDDELKGKLSSVVKTVSFEDVDIYYVHDDFYWYFGFWDRRFTEGNAEIVYTILTEINEHYKD